MNPVVHRGKTSFGDHGDQACDSDNRLDEDLEILKKTWGKMPTGFLSVGWGFLVGNF